MAAERLHLSILHHVVNTLGWPSLRPLQEQAIEPVMRGDDALLIAPTAGGKTEAALFPLLTRMHKEDWTGLSVLYVCPLRALLNNLEPRIASYAAWLGRTAQVRHGDTPVGERRRMQEDPPDILLTTPESLEAMLISTLVAPRELFGRLRAVVVDEVHAFAGDDRGWHLLAVLERLTRLAGRRLQRIGLSATIGNPQQLLGWLQGSGRGVRPGVVVAPPAPGQLAPDLQLDYVGTLANAAQVIAALHQGEKRLVFADSRRRVEALAVALRERGVDTYVSHSSLSPHERRRAEAAFAGGRDCVIVATSTLELGVDVGDLDRVIQVGAPRTVASLLQRLGRTGRRTGTRANMLVLATDDDELLQAAAVLRLWTEGYVEPVVPPPSPRHVAAQQLLALCLQEGRVGQAVWHEWLGRLPMAMWDAGEAEELAQWLLDTGHLDRDGGMLYVGPEADRRYGRRHFLELVSVFTAAPEITVWYGREEIGSVDPAVLAAKVSPPRIIALAGRSWQVNHVDWIRRRAWVEPSHRRGVAHWNGIAQPLSFAVCDAMRRVLLGDQLGSARLTRRAINRLDDVRQRRSAAVDPDGTVVLRDTDNRVRWWTWGGGRANTLIAAALSRVAPHLVHDLDRFDNCYLRLNETPGLRRDLMSALDVVRRDYGDGLAGVVSGVDEAALRQLKFAELLPPELARTALAERMADRDAAAHVLGRRLLFST